MKRFGALGVVLSGLVSTANAARPVDAFWRWFQQNEDRLFQVDDEDAERKIFPELAAEMHKVDEDLTFEFGPVHDGKREFVISADGIKESFPYVEELYRAAPDLPRWIWVKFRPRRKPMDVSIGDFKLRVDSVRIVFVDDDEPMKLGLLVIIPQYESSADHDKLDMASFLILDQALGEYDVETKVGSIEFVSVNPSPGTESFTLKELPEAFDTTFRAKTQRR